MTQQEFFERYTYNVRSDKIGGGSFGTVYKAEDNLLHRKVALKVSEVKVINGKEFSLKDEFEAIKNLPSHPNIANYEELHTFETPQGIFDYAIMQFYEDGNLSDIIKQSISNEQKEQIATALLHGINHLHSHKVVHRDLKPGNILIVKRGDKIIPVITDFGLSKQVWEDEASRFSMSFGGGTLKYSSPEQLKAEKIRLNTDLWSYGVIVYRLFTGKDLFAAKNQSSGSTDAEEEIIKQIKSKDVSSDLAKLPAKWQKIAEKCLIRDSAKRVKSAEALINILHGKNLENTETSQPTNLQTYQLTNLSTSKPQTEPVRRSNSEDENLKPTPDKTSIESTKPESEKPINDKTNVETSQPTVAERSRGTNLKHQTSKPKNFQTSQPTNIETSQPQTSNFKPSKKILIPAAIAFVLALTLFIWQPWVSSENNNESSKYGSFIDSRDGKSYKTVKIGNQVWMAENLNYSTSSGSWCYDDKISNCNKYGRLYDWETAKKVCPEGWHLPTKSEFDILLENVGGKGEVAYNELISGGKSGFSALFGGWRNYENSYDYINMGASIWSATSVDYDKAYYFAIDVGYEQAAILKYNKDVGFSLRCIKD